MLVIQARPYQYSWSGNAIFYQLFSNEAFADSGVYFEIKVMFSNNVNWVDIEAVDIVTIPYIPLKGVAKINIQDVLDSILNYGMPGFNADDKLPYESVGQSGKFYILYRQVTAGSSEPSWETGENLFIRTVFKGGISFFKYQAQNFWLNYFNIKLPFLTWQMTKKLANVHERMFLAFMTFFNIADGNMKMRVRVVFADRTESTQDQVLHILPFRVWYLPTGADQWGLQALQPAKKIWFWEVSVWDYTDPANPANLSEIYRYYSDNRNDYNDVTIHFRNSLGGLDSMHIRGVIQSNLDYTTIEKDGVFDADYYSGDIIQAPGGVVDNLEIISFKGDIGYMGKEEQDRLRDAYTKRETYQAINSKWCPLVISQKSFTQKSSTDSRWSLPIEWKAAISGDRYYTPGIINLGNDPLQSNTCPLGVKNWNIETEIDGGVNYLDNSFEVDGVEAPLLIEFKIVGFEVWSTIAAPDGYPGVTNFRFAYATGQEYIIVIRVRCANGEYGKETSKTIKIDDPVLPVPPTNSIIRNNSSIGVSIALKIDGVTQNLSIGSNGTAAIDVANLNDVQIVVRFEIAYTPSYSDLVSNGVGYPGIITIAGGQGIITFNHVNIIGGIIVTWG